MFVFETYERQRISFHLTTLLWIKWETNPTLPWFNDEFVQNAPFLASLKWGRGGGGEVYPSFDLRACCKFAAWCTDRWSKNVGLMPSTRDISKYCMSVFINTMQIICNSHHVRSVPGKEVACPSLIFKYVFGFDFLWSTGLYLVILRTLTNITAKKLESIGPAVHCFW